MAEAQLSETKAITDFSFDESLIEFTVPKQEWLRINDKHFDGLSTAAFVFDTQGRVLLIQRAAHDSMPNTWESPGGAVDTPDASILHGCARELREETGLIATRITRLVTEGEGREKWSVFTNRTGVKMLCGFAFEVEVEDAGKPIVLDPNEHQDWIWATEEEAIAEKLESGREIPLSGIMGRNRLLEVFRLRKHDAQRAAL